MALAASRREQAAKMLVEGDARFLGGAGGVGIEGPEKILDFLTDLDLLTAVYDDLPWLNLILHFRLHSLTHPQRSVARASEEAAPRAAFLNTYATVKFLFWGGGKPKYRKELAW